MEEFFKELKTIHTIFNQRLGKELALKEFLKTFSKKFLENYRKHF